MGPCGVWFLVLWHHHQKLGGIRWYCGFSLSRTSFSKGNSSSSSVHQVSDGLVSGRMKIHGDSNASMRRAPGIHGNVLTRFGIQNPWDHAPWFPEDTRFGNQYRYPKTNVTFSNKHRNHREKVSSKPKEPNDCWGLTIYFSGRLAYLERNRHL